ncbi:MAG: 50S ribosomal protein L32 [Patescibacteria group bacterium]
MAATPKRKISTYRKGKRFAGHKLLLTRAMKCPQCGTAKKSHFLCTSCGK